MDRTPNQISLEVELEADELAYTLNEQATPNFKFALVYGLLRRDSALVAEIKHQFAEGKFDG